jgi:hypothetical protein
VEAFERMAPCNFAGNPVEIYLIKLADLRLGEGSRCIYFAARACISSAWGLQRINGE